MSNHVNHMGNSIQSILDLATTILPNSDTARLDAEVLLQSVLDCERSHFYSHPEKHVTTDKLNSFQSLLELRIKGTPIAYLTRQKEFWTLNLKVTEDTLIPRPETELLVEYALKQIPKDRQMTVLDLGTGTGAIALAIAKERPLVKIIATDITESTLNIARFNAEQNQINIVQFIQSNWFSNLENSLFDLIISNPPYIAEHDAHLNRGDVRFEPRQALISGNDGLDDLKIIIEQSLAFLKPKGRLLLEHGYDQGGKVIQLLKSNRYSNINVLNDLAGYHRSSTAIFDY